MSASGTTTIDFGSFPGKSDTSVAVTGQTGIVSSSLVEAWIRPVATADHSADEHMLETIKVIAGNIITGTGFTIYGLNTSSISEPFIAPKAATYTAQGQTALGGFGGGQGTRIYGQFTVAWAWA